MTDIGFGVWHSKDLEFRSGRFLRTLDNLRGPSSVNQLVPKVYSHADVHKSKIAELFFSAITGLIVILLWLNENILV
ncbi:hypothetical protein CAP36_05375 [Chitinophagaceae bacterium IBVUCB2]|nr:hypothetical protein CAP36_05375 [Chitinophagaceae bacterium IBVUCB2]